MIDRSSLVPCSARSFFSSFLAVRFTNNLPVTMSVGDNDLAEHLRRLGIDPDSDWMGWIALKEGQLDTFSEVWTYIFLWSFFSSLAIHACAAGLAAICLNRHAWALWICLSIFLSGVVLPLSVGALTSAVITWVTLESVHSIPALYCVLFGIAQTLLYVIMSFTKILATL